jgi:hypothetical protein
VEEIAKDRQYERENQQKTLSKFLYFGFAIFLVLTVFLCVALWIGKDAIALEVIKAILYILPSVLGAYSYGFNRGKASEDSSDDS